MSFAEPSEFPLPETEVTAPASLTLFCPQHSFHSQALSVPVVSGSLYPQLISVGGCIFLRAGGCPKVLALIPLSTWDIGISDQLLNCPDLLELLETSYSPSDMWAKAMAFLPCLLRGNCLQKEIGDLWPGTIS